MANNRINPLTGKRYAWEEARAAEKAADPNEELKQIEQRLALLKRQQKAMESRERFMTFVKFTSPDPEDPNDVEKSRYKNAKHHDAIARVVEEVIKGEIPFLILTMPPRHGKSELVSRRLPAWLIGKHPEWNGVVATYNDDFASDFGKDVRGIVKTPQFKQAFPSVNLQRGGAASDRLQTTKGGQWSFVGRGGSLTGRGGHCFPAGTLVSTNKGQIPIEQLPLYAASVKILSYDRHTGQIAEKGIQAFAARKATRLFRISTASGRVVEATGDHPFLTPRGYVEASELTPGDSLLCLLRGECGEDGVRSTKAHEARPRAFLLLKSMLGKIRERSTLWAAQMRRLRRGSPTTLAEGFAQDDLLLVGVPNGSSRAGKSRTPREMATAHLRRMFNRVPGGPLADTASREKRETANSVLRHGLQEQRTFTSDVRETQSGLQARFGSETAHTRSASVSLHEADYRGAGWELLYDLPVDETVARSSHRSRSTGQSVGKPDNALPSMPFQPAWPREIESACEADCVRAIDEIPVPVSGSEVFDLEVEGTHNFFANGVCVSNCMILDDLIKDDKEAQSQAIRDQAWNWFTKVAMSRRMGMKLVIMTFTRWHSDDPIGRLTDPENPHYNAKLAEKIKIINLPAIADEDDPLGRAPGEPLWPDGPDKFDLDFLEEQRSLDPLGFEALYQQRPSLMDGDMFKREDIRFYEPGELPQDLRIYCTSDHAVATGQRNDFTVLLKAGVDREGNIYLIDCWWRKEKADVVVEQMLNMGGRGNLRPTVWFAEKGHISKSIGPFLRKRMLESNAFFPLKEITPIGDKATRAQSIAGRVASGRVFFPKGATWTEKAINEMMAFPNGLHDDFCDCLSLLGLQLQNQFGPGKSVNRNSVKPPEFGTLEWVKLADKWATQQREQRMAGGF